MDLPFELDLEPNAVTTFVDAEVEDDSTNTLVLIDESSNAQLQSCLADFGLSSLTVDEFISAGVDALNKSLVEACKAGVAFWAAQESIKNATTPGVVGNFKEWTERYGLVESRVYECIRLAKYYARLPENQRVKMLMIGKKQALLLAKIPQEVVDNISDSGTDLLTEAETMTFGELRDLLKNAERKNQQLNAEIEHRDAVIDRYKKRDSREYEFHWKTHTVRDECLAYQAECEVALTSLQQVFKEQATDIEKTEQALRIEQCWITANVIAARAAALICYLRDESPVELPESISSRHMLSDDEAQRWLLDYPMIERKHEAAKARREETRPKRAGRPKVDK